MRTTDSLFCIYLLCRPLVDGEYQMSLILLSFTSLLVYQTFQNSKTSLSHNPPIRARINSYFLFLLYPHLTYPEVFNQ